MPSLPVQGGPPTNLFSFGDVQHRLQIFPLFLVVFLLFGLPATIRKPYSQSDTVSQPTSGTSHLLERSYLASRNVIYIKATFVNELPLGASVADLRDSNDIAIFVLEEHDRSPCRYPAISTATVSLEATAVMALPAPCFLLSMNPAKRIKYNIQRRKKPLTRYLYSGIYEQ
jgi:hypothetical protein